MLLFETVAFLGEVPIGEFLFGTVDAALLRQAPALPLVTGTLLASAIAMLVALPAGLMTAIYLSEHAPAGLRRIVKPCSSCSPACRPSSTATSRCCS